MVCQIRLNVEEVLRNSLRQLPFTQTSEQHYSKEISARMDEAQAISVSPVVTVSFKKAPFLPSEKEDPKGRKEARKRDVPAMENVTMEWSDNRKESYSVPLGTLLNIAASLIEDKLPRITPEPLTASTEMDDFLRYGEQCALAEKAEKVNAWIDALVEEGKHRGAEKITANKTLMLFLALSLQPDSLPNSDLGSCKAYCLADIVFYTFYYAEEVSRTAPVLRRCKMCERLFFASPSNREYCYFEVKDEILHGVSCFIAKDTRKTREESSQQEINKVLARIRASTSDAEGYALPDRYSFQDAYNKKKEEFESHPWMKRHLIEWLRVEEEAMKRSKAGGDDNG